MSATISMFRSGARVAEAPAQLGDTLYDVIIAAGVYLDAPCGGRGKCGKCLVRLSPDGEWERACQTHVTGDMTVYLPDTAEMEIAGDTGKAKKIDYSGPLGVAVDIGTTTVVAHLTEMKTGTRLSTASGVNAQRAFGADVISRIQYCAENGHEKLTEVIRGELHELFYSACRKAGAKPEEIKFISIAGNTIMQHLADNRSPVAMGVAPFTPESLYGYEVPAGDDLGVAPDAKLYYAPCVYSYVGGDITAGMLASDLEHIDGNVVYIDIGTNGELVLKTHDKYYCCATAAGPAFEGAEIAKGMAAIHGAISHVKWIDGTGLDLTVIGGDAPAGLCGSGLMDALALLVATGAVDETGRLMGDDEVTHPISACLGSREGKNVFWLDKARDVYMCPADIRKLQLAKAAIAAGIQTLLAHAGIAEQDVTHFLLAGGFGSFLDKTSAATIGLFPKSFLPVARTMGNTAGEGASLALWQPGAREALDAMMRRFEVVELSTSPVFNDQFIEQMMFE